MKTISSISASRRRFLKQASAAVLATLPVSSRAARASSQTLSSAGAASVEDLIIRNRAPLAPNAFYTLPLGSVRPTGWLRSQLQVQANGLGGHLDETWPDVGSNSACAVMSKNQAKAIVQARCRCLPLAPGACAI